MTVTNTEMSNNNLFTSYTPCRRLLDLNKAFYPTKSVGRYVPSRLSFPEKTACKPSLGFMYQDQSNITGGLVAETERLLCMQEKIQTWWWQKKKAKNCVCNHLNAVFPGRWIGRGGPIPWPASSPDLNPLDYFLWGYLKSLVFETTVETDMDLVARIVAACDVIQNTAGIFVMVRQNLVRWCHACIEIGGVSIWATVVRCKMVR